MSNEPHSSYDAGDMTPDGAEKALLPLLDYLAATSPGAAVTWNAWQIAPIAGAGNNLLYRASGPGGDFAVKFTIRDGRNRVGREYRALLALRQAGLDLAPAAVWLDRDRYPQPVVVQTWLAGRVAPEPPADDAEWRAMLEHLVSFHRLGPADVRLLLAPAVLQMTSATAGMAHIAEQVARLPAEAQPSEMRDLLQRVAALDFPAWPAAPPRLCRCDPNTLNFVRRPGGWASVDWENSGWGDPAFEIADLLAHPQYRTVSAPRRDWIIGTYCALQEDAGAATRIRVYYLLTLVWWVARLTRYRYEIPRGLDRRLVAPPADWQADVQAKYEDYLQRTAALLP